MDIIAATRRVWRGAAFVRTVFAGFSAAETGSERHATSDRRGYRGEGTDGTSATEGGRRLFSRGEGNVD